MEDKVKGGVGMTIYTIWGKHVESGKQRLIAAIEEDRWDEEGDWYKEIVELVDKKIDEGVFEFMSTIKLYVDEEEFDVEFDKGCSEEYDEDLDDEEYKDDDLLEEELEEEELEESLDEKDEAV